VEHASSISAYPSQLFADAHYISPAARSWIFFPLDGRESDGADAVTFSMMECYFQITVPSFSGILRKGVLSVVFSESRDLSML
jgi:hypothetical protein